MKELEERGFGGWTLVPKVLGKGGRSDPRMDNDVWPGYSSLLLVFVRPERYGDFLSLVREYDGKVSPFKAFLLKDVQEI